MITRRGLITGGAAMLAYARLAQGRNPRGASRAAVPGTWVNVTPSNMNLTNTYGGNNYGIQTVGADAGNPGTLYGYCDVQGIWKSTDYGQTWTGPVNTGTNGTNIGYGGIGCSGSGITVVPNATAGQPATIYAASIRSTNNTSYPYGLYKSTNGGVDWTYLTLSPAPGTTGQDCYEPQVNPYNSNHLLLCGHENAVLLESLDGGSTWTNIPLVAGMVGTQNTAFCFFINTGSNTVTNSTAGGGTTATTWLFVAQIQGGAVGTWRTNNSGTTWTQVNTQEHAHGCCQIYQVGMNDGLSTSGVVYLPGDYGQANTFGGVLRSADYGQTWSAEGANSYGSGESVVWGTSKDVYAMYSWAEGLGSVIGGNYQVAAQPGTGTYSAPTLPSGMYSASAMTAVLNNGSNNIFIAACWGAGLWRYVEA